MLAQIPENFTVRRKKKIGRPKLMLPPLGEICKHLGQYISLVVPCTMCNIIRK